MKDHAFDAAAGGAMLKEALKGASYDCVVIGGGLRIPPEKLGVVRDGCEHHPQRGAESGGDRAFNTRPEDTADEARPPRQGWLTGRTPLARLTDGGPTRDERCSQARSKPRGTRDVFYFTCHPDGGTRARARAPSACVPTRNPSHQDRHLSPFLTEYRGTDLDSSMEGVSGSEGDLSRDSLSVGDLCYAQIVGGLTS